MEVRIFYRSETIPNATFKKNHNNIFQCPQIKLNPWLHRPIPSLRPLANMLSREFTREFIVSLQPEYLKNLLSFTKARKL